MKKAKEMFEKLGYKYNCDYLYGIGEDKTYENNEHMIRFYSSIESYGIQFYVYDQSGYVEISPKVLKAINKQVEELGWSHE